MLSSSINGVVSSGSTTSIVSGIVVSSVGDSGSPISISVSSLSSTMTVASSTEMIYPSESNYLSGSLLISIT